MKKVFASLLAGAVCLSLAALPVSAGSATEAGDIELGTNFTFEYKNDPTYTVTIPDALTIEKEGSVMSIEASDVENLGDQKISVTIAGTDKFRDQMLLEGKTEDGQQASLRNYFEFEDARRIETVGSNINGTEIVSFTENATKSFTVKPILEGSSSIKKGVTYTGSMTYGIELVPVE